MTKRHIVIATRESPLALAQTEWVKQRLQTLHPHLSVDFLGITTQADKMLNVKLVEIGGKGLFVKELEDALYAGKADIAVHSMKDVPMDLPSGLVIPAICAREDPRDAFVSNDYKSWGQLPGEALVGTSSLRRQTQLKTLRSDLTLQNLRGNVNTRLGRLDQGDFSAIILAAAGLKRLNLASRIKSYFSTDQCLPAAGQGALGIECREDDTTTLALISQLNDINTQRCVQAERTVCRQIGGGCMVPVAAFAEIHQGLMRVRGLVASSNGIRILRAHREGKPEEAESLGLRVAEELMQQGAKQILKEFST